MSAWVSCALMYAFTHLPLQIYTYAPLLMQYFTSFHVAVMCFTGNEMLPKTDFELVLASILILLAYIINGNIFGTMAVLVGVMNKKSNQYTKQIVDANLSMAKIMLPADLSVRIRDYLVATQSKADQ